MIKPNFFLLNITWINWFSFPVPAIIMFSFHRPKVYRSSTGCCICKAKSSRYDWFIFCVFVFYFVLMKYISLKLIQMKKTFSSRFTDSKKYEEDFMECFKLSTPRQGEICNACVLLVKRWKKLPVGSERNWQHVSVTNLCIISVSISLDALGLRSLLSSISYSEYWSAGILFFWYEVMNLSVKFKFGIITCVKRFLN